MSRPGKPLSGFAGPLRVGPHPDTNLDSWARRANPAGRESFPDDVPVLANRTATKTTGILPISPFRPNSFLPRAGNDIISCNSGTGMHESMTHRERTRVPMTAARPAVTVGRIPDRVVQESPAAGPNSPGYVEEVFAMLYLGSLSESDPLHGYLCHDILPQLGREGHRPRFEVYRFNASNNVYLYADGNSDLRVVGKFFTASGRNGSRHERMRREFANLNMMRDLGFNSYPHYVVRPLGCNAAINNVLVEEYCFGMSLGDAILSAIRHRNRDLLFGKLTALAYFLASFHNRTAGSPGIDFASECRYFLRIVDRLQRRGYLGHQDANDLERMVNRWRSMTCVWEDRRVLVHGDATPANFLFGDGLWVIALDLERVKVSDRAFDLGRVAGEIKHFFMQYQGDKYAAEPFIGHFLWEYACHFPDREAAFASVTARLPFYIALTELRVAANPWIEDGHRRALLEEACLTLQ